MQENFEYKESILMMAEIKKDNIFIDKQIKNVKQIEGANHYRDTKLNELYFLKASNKDLFNHLKYLLN